MSGKGKIHHEFVWEEREELTPTQTVFVFYGTILMIVLAQSALVQWKKMHKRSFDSISLLGLWLAPALISLNAGYWRFLMIWAAYSSATGYIIFLSSRKPLAQHVPKMAYTWFIGVYNLSVMIGTAGCFLIFGMLLGLGPIEFLIIPPALVVLLWWYGVYFGLLTRDCAELANEILASTMGTGGKGNIVVSINRCGICNNSLENSEEMGGTGSGQTSSSDHYPKGGLFGPRAKHRTMITPHPQTFLGSSGGNDVVEPINPTLTLPCRHQFHEFCLRGWMMVGKKGTCPTCNEKVDFKKLRQLNTKPWDRGSLYWMQLLDMVRYMVVWNPIVFWIVDIFFYEIGIFKHL